MKSRRFKEKDVARKMALTLTKSGFRGVSIRGEK